MTFQAGDRIILVNGRRDLKAQPIGDYLFGEPRVHDCGEARAGVAFQELVASTRFANGGMFKKTISR